MFTDTRPYKIHWELTDICNLKCPMCPRTDHCNHCRPVRHLKHVQFSFADVRQNLPLEFLEGVTRIDFCGNYGDPCMARDFHEICAYLSGRHQITIMISTNGAMHQEDWWKKLAITLAGTGSWVAFHIDGLEDTNHFYRIGARWDQLMKNCSAFISAGGQAEWHFLVFDHNLHQIDEARSLASTMGFESFVPTYTSRFPTGKVFPFQHTDGRWLELKGAQTDGTNLSGDAPSPSDVNSGQRQSRRIHCKSANKNRFYIDAQGFVSPCCWVANRDPERQGDMLNVIHGENRNIDSFNLFQRPIKEIIDDPLFSECFPHYWNHGQLSTCLRKCGLGKRNLMVREKLTAP